MFNIISQYLHIKLILYYIHIEESKLFILTIKYKPFFILVAGKYVAKTYYNKIGHNTVTLCLTFIGYTLNVLHHSYHL